ncbi:Kae1-associated kinase Bud32 [Methanolobus halotolerans]|uniref:non-specific serine/threonine protein kinase n=1 Tax=Methanolobus halotolerans TaxID=2052935 RepID=A0A4E0QTP2_9EURY|nr:Kae1-associated kinase Bud32 [Methanolobus halotolerans]TGC11365.1 Kae1-associated kinase Bud32 [Methanolobus halotolerans]
MYLTRGAEATVKVEGGYVIKVRIPKQYRQKELDERIRKERTKNEARLISEARRLGIPTPIVHDVQNSTIVMQYIPGTPLKYVVDESLSERLGELVGNLHTGGIIHGDLTTSNMIVYNDRIYMIDFGLSFIDPGIEARGVDIHVLFQTFESTHHDHEILTDAFCRGYRQTCDNAEEVLERVRDIEKRGRYA